MTAAVGPVAAGRGGLIAVALIAAAIAGAGNAFRAACWTQTEGFVCGPLARTPPAATKVSSLTTAVVTVPDWRPLRITFRSRSVPGVPPASVRVGTVATMADGVRLEPDGRTAVLTTTARAAGPNRLVLWAEPSTPGTTAVLDVLDVAPAPAVWPALSSFAVGAGMALLVVWGGRGSRDTTPARMTTRPGSPWWKCRIAPRRARRPAIQARGGRISGIFDRRATPSDGMHRPSNAAGLSPRAARLDAVGASALAGLLALYAAWAVLRPPLQSPDEPQHHARATSIVSTPWIGGAREVSVAAAHRNPLTWTPGRLHAIIFNTAERLSAADVDTLRAASWTPASPYPAVERLPSPVASYPPTYYWIVFAGGESLTRVFGLSPLTSHVAYRVVSAFCGWLVWAAVYLVLRSAPETRPHAVAIWLPLAGTPTVATMASAVNPDAIATPAIVLLFVAAWRVLATGECRRIAIAAAALALAVKPVGVFAVLAVMVSAAVWAGVRAADRPRAIRLARDLSAVGAIAWLVFYAWSPPQLQPAPGAAPLSLPAYVWSLIARTPGFWIELWGRLGWMEYGAAPAWYAALLVACLACAATAMIRRDVDGGLTRHALVVSATYEAAVIWAEYVNHAVVGLYAQGRYFAPATFALAPALCQPGAARWLLLALIGGLHAALAAATIDRYFGGDWALWWRLLT
jgi:Predicted membrane protein (DUF2142)